MKKTSFKNVHSSVPRSIEVVCFLTNYIFSIVHITEQFYGIQSFSINFSDPL